jgi:hypothetical protein
VLGNVKLSGIFQAFLDVSDFSHFTFSKLGNVKLSVEDNDKLFVANDIHFGATDINFGKRHQG